MIRRRAWCLLLLPVLASAAMTGCAAPAPHPTALPTATSTPATIGDTLNADGWKVTIATVALDADEAVAAANEFNPRPGSEEKYALVDVVVTRTGPPRSALDLGFALVVGDKTLPAAPAVAPVPLHVLNEYATSDSVSGQLAFLVPDDTEDADVKVSFGPSRSFLVQPQ